MGSHAWEATRIGVTVNTKILRGIGEGGIHFKINNI
jgi:hypothetical protein